MFRSSEVSTARVIVGVDLLLVRTGLLFRRCSMHAAASEGSKTQHPLLPRIQVTALRFPHSELRDIKGPVTCMLL